MRNWATTPYYKENLKLTSHDILHLCSADLSKSFFFNCVNIYLFSIFFSIDFVRCKNLLSIDCVNIYLFSLFSSQDFGRWKSVGLPPHSLHISRFINFNLHVTGPWCSFKKKFINICDAFSYSFSVFTSFSCVWKETPEEASNFFPFYTSWALNKIWLLENNQSYDFSTYNFSGVTSRTRVAKSLIESAQAKTPEILLRIIHYVRKIFQKTNIS